MLPINSPLLVQKHKQRHTGHFPIPTVFLYLANWLPFKQAQAASSLGLDRLQLHQYYSVIVE